MSPDGRDGSLQVNQDTFFLRGRFDSGASCSHAIQGQGAGAYIFVIEGSIEIAGETLDERDAIGIWETSSVELLALTEADVLCIEVPMHAH